jgi:hypothetical protein
MVNHIYNVVIGINQTICKDILLASIGQVKAQCSVVTHMLMIKLD